MTDAERIRRAVDGDPAVARAKQHEWLGRRPCPVCGTVHGFRAPCPQCGPFETLGELEDAFRNGRPAADEVGIFDDVDTEADTWAPTNPHPG